MDSDPREVFGVLQLREQTTELQPVREIHFALDSVVEAEAEAVTSEMGDLDDVVQHRVIPTGRFGSAFFHPGRDTSLSGAPPRARAPTRRRSMPRTCRCCIGCAPDPVRIH